MSCKCLDCGKLFNKGDEGDNENFCLRCEAIAIALENADMEYQDLGSPYEY